APDSPAYRAGLERGDVIIAINGEKVRNVDEAIAILKGFRVDAEYVLTIVRHGKTFDLQLKPEERSRRRQWY
ncbi:MAG: PDZ domain-containing protein, partial [Gemmatimonadetes bacterium]|nr:PDZ domain-containing protein [Gemmatimonadota bacterium]